MPKLYHNGQREGWQTPGKQDKGAARIDIPSSPEELAAWLNTRRVGPTGIAARMEETPELEELIEEARDRIPTLAPAFIAAPTPDRCPECQRQLTLSAEGAGKLAIGKDVDAIGDWMSTAPDWALQRIAELAEGEAAAIRGKGKAH